MPLGEHLCPICKMGRAPGVNCKDLIGHGARWDVK